MIKVCVFSLLFAADELLSEKKSSYLVINDIWPAADILNAIQPTV